jgi:membrane protease YdiL (CAAX protease family)
VNNGPEPLLGRPDGRKSAFSLRDWGLGRKGPAGPLLVSLLATIVATALSYALPDSQAATGVGLVFLVFTYVLVLRDADTNTVAESGLSLGGLFEPEPLSPARLARSALGAFAWALAFALVLFPPFWLGFVLWHAPVAHFSPASLLALGRDVLGQVFGVAFPEEVFFRGYLQSALDRSWPPRFKLFGARLGPALLVSSAIFAVGHLLTDPHPARLAVFFPSLVFGILRARTGGVGASIAFHAMCNLFASFLGRSYGLY